MGQALQFQRFFSIDSPKAIKASKYGYLNAINYMAPHKSGGRGNLCANASPGCIALCLGWYSGQASLVADLERDVNNVRRSRIRKTQAFFNDTQRFMHEAAYHIVKLERRARKLGLKLCVRLNGSSDIPFERILIDKIAAVHENKTIFELFPHVQFVDYTKILSRVLSADKPKNLHLTFSRSELNESECEQALNAGVNVAVVFGDGLPKHYLNRPVIDGDQHDLRHLDKQGKRGFIVGLSPKGRKAKRDTSGFVVRKYHDKSLWSAELSQIWNEAA